MSNKKRMEPSWREIERPTGPQALPAWLQDLHVDWMDEYCNSPDFRLKTTCDLHRWEGQRWKRDGRLYSTEHPDGLRRQLWHDGAVSLTEIRGEQVMATTQQEGFGGAHYRLTMEDGSVIVLRGPWAGGAPNGWNEAAFVDVSQHLAPYWRGKPWHKLTACAGVFISNDLLIRAYATFQPHLRLALVDQFGDGRFTVQPMKDEWDAPKRWVYMRKLEAARAAAGTGHKLAA